ncbi:MAG: hypothetical protein WC974_04450 [Thermoplasmata archaeon]
MTDDGKNILEMMRQLRKLDQQLSLLLKSADEQMNRAGWEAFNNTVMSDSSGSLENPLKWSPDCLFRFYLNGEYPHVLFFVSVILDDDVQKEYKITEPLITAGCFDAGRGKNVKILDWRWRYAKCYARLENSVHDGEVYASKSNWQKDWDDSKYKLYKCFGYPLVSISTAEDIETKIVQPLLTLV